MGSRTSRPVGVVLAGGLGRRLGGPKATIRLGGRPLISYPVRALQDALGRVVVVAKAGTDLPSLPGVEVWIEPEEPRHPLTGIVHALESSEGRPVLVCACDLPLVAAEVIQEIAAAPEEALAVLACGPAGLQPLLGRYPPQALGPLTAALHAGLSVKEAVGSLKTRHHRIRDPAVLLNVNTPGELREAEGLLGERAGAAQPNVKS